MLLTSFSNKKTEIVKTKRHGQQKKTVLLFMDYGMRRCEIVTLEKRDCKSFGYSSACRVVMDCCIVAWNYKKQKPKISTVSCPKKSLTHRFLGYTNNMKAEKVIMYGFCLGMFLSTNKEQPTYIFSNFDPIRIKVW